VFSGIAEGKRLHIWRADTASGNIRQLTDGNDDSSADCSPDGEWIIYSSSTESGYRLMRTRMSGGSAESLLERRGLSGSYSPQGNQLAILQSDAEDVTTLGVMNPESGQPTMKFSLPPSGQIPDNYAKPTWKPDGTAITYLLEQGPTVNVWNQPVAGGPPHQLTHGPDRVFAFAWSPDGKHLAYTRAAISRDVVLLKF